MSSGKMAFVVQVHKVELKHNGGRVQMDFGLDAVEQMAEIAKLAAIKDMNFKIVICVLDPDAPTSDTL